MMQVVDCRYPIIYGGTTNFSPFFKYITHMCPGVVGAPHIVGDPDSELCGSDGSLIFSCCGSGRNHLRNQQDYTTGWQIYEDPFWCSFAYLKSYMLYMYRAFVWLTAMSAWHSLAQCHPSYPEPPLICKAFCWKGMRNSCQEMRSLSSSSIRVGTAK